MWLKKDLIDTRARFWVLMAGGSTLVAACDTVGVNRRTGRRHRTPGAPRGKEVGAGYCEDQSSSFNQPEGTPIDSVVRCAELGND